MRFARRSTPPRHLAGASHLATGPASIDPTGFDVDAAFEADFDFEALFAADGTAAAEVVPKARVPRHRVAIAASVTLAALPLLFLDNFQANASMPSKVDAGASRDQLGLAGPPLTPDSTAQAGQSVGTPVADAPATVFVASPVASATVAPSPTASPTTLARTTTTTAKPKVKVEAAVTAPTTTTTARPAPTTTTTVAPTTSSARAGSGPDPSSDATWDQLAKCESGGNWAANTGNGYYGGLQFNPDTWHGLGGTGYPNEASRAQQIAIGKKQYAASGWSAWRVCAGRLGWT